MQREVSWQTRRRWTPEKRAPIELSAGFSVGGDVYGRADTTGPPTHAHVSVRPPLHLGEKNQACRSEPWNVLRSRRHRNVAVAA